MHRQNNLLPEVDLEANMESVPFLAAGAFEAEVDVPAEIEQREPRLHDQLNDCIEILEEFEEEITPDLKKHRNSMMIKYAAVTTGALGVMTGSALTIAYAIVSDNEFHDNIRSLELSLAQSQAQYDAIYAMAIGKELKFKEDQNLNNLLQLVGPKRDTCENWTDENGQKQFISGYFPDFDYREYCWFSDHNATYPDPVAYCNDLVKERCEIKTEEAMLLAPYSDSLSQLQGKVNKLYHERYGIDYNAHHRSLELNTFLCIGTVSLSLCFLACFLAYIRTPYYKYKDECNNTEKVAGVIKDPAVYTRVSNLVTYLGLTFAPVTSIVALLIELKKVALEMTAREGRRYAFFAGIKDSNADAHNHRLLITDKQHAAVETIFDYAEIMPKMRGN